MTGFGFTTAEAETGTSVQVNELEVLAKLEVRQEWQGTNQNSRMTVIAS